MKIFFGVLFIFFALLTIVNTFILKNKKSKIKKSCMLYSAVTFITTIMYMGTFIFNNHELNKVFFLLYFISMDMLCGSMLYFTRSFVGGKRKIIYIIMILCLFFDMCFMIFFSIHKYPVSFEVIEFTNNSYLIYHSKGYFYVHLLICYIPVLFSFILFAKSIIFSPKLYKFQYATISVIIAFIVIINSFFTRTGVPVDFSVLGYSFAATMCILFTFYILPNSLQNKMSHEVINSLDVAIILFDIHKNNIMENVTSKKWFTEEENEYKNIIKNFDLEKNPEEIKKEVRLQMSKNGQTFYYQAFYYQLITTNRKGKSENNGCYFICYDKTIEERRRKEREYRLTHDELTGIYNANYFYQNVENMIEQPQKNKCIAIINIISFKLFNEVFGSEMGDIILNETAKKLRENLDDKKIVYARLENDRFALFGNENEILDFFNKNNEIFLPSIMNDYRLLMSIGICEIENSQDSVKKFCERAQIALNTIKGNVEERIAYYNLEIKEKLLYENHLIKIFDSALENGEFNVYIQPQFDSVTNTLVGGEALIRWIRDGKIIPPKDFISSLEQNGLITRLDRYVWEETAKLIRFLCDHKLECSISVNISAIDLYACNIYDVFSSLVDKYQIKPQLIKLELTESEIIKNISRQIELINKLHEKGFIIEMDDFGSGFSSLNTLKDIPVDVLKMDMNFLDKTPNRKKSNIIVETIINLANRLEIPVLAEGVEVEGQLKFLHSVGCKYIQGYLFGKPMDIENFIAIRRSSNYKDIITK